MKALVYYGPCDMRVVDFDKPTLQKGEAFLKVKAVGICGSDVHGYLGLTGRRTPPMIMGHEVVAEVVSVESKESKYQSGNIVFIDPITVCDVCENCKEGYTSICINKKNIGVLEENGAFCEYLCMPEDNLIAMPPGIDAKIGVLAEPFSVAHHAVNQVNKQRVTNVAVIGAGVIGICTAAVLKERYNESTVLVMDIDRQRLERCKDILGDRVNIVDIAEKSYEEIKVKYAPQGFDVVMEAVGIESTVNGSLSLVKSKGSIVLIGNNQKNISLAYRQIVTREINVLGTYGFTHKDLECSIASLKERPYVNKMVDKVISLEEAKQYFDILAEKGHNFLKIIVDPSL